MTGARKLNESEMNNDHHFELKTGIITDRISCKRLKVINELFDAITAILWDKVFDRTGVLPWLYQEMA